MRSPAKPRRPFWITLNKVLLGLHHLADDAGVVRATEAEIARPSHVGARSMQSALEVLEDRGFVRAEYHGGTTWTVTLLDDEPGGPDSCPPAPSVAAQDRPESIPLAPPVVREEDHREEAPVQLNFAWWDAHGK